ncbi:hypothetical protein N7495_009024 [Penicillium taxi]|uniref:uncharacterized protein n=1 Tax=Penicillium taxi TaxID=168475 RepID=UPI0025458EB9|nr:uncharacterized protein N7495_009024 [Penicillium taxi]KAJ5888983.1 hypothetical protein N7495_009024 [Penicillium taxi]
MADVEEQPVKRRIRSRRAPPDRKFHCSHDGCGKSYSRAEHLARHQLNHAPKQIFHCEYCPRSFVRQDLCFRHQERHSTRGSQLQKRDYFAHEAYDERTKSIPHASSPSSPSITIPDYQYITDPTPNSKSPPVSAYPLSTGNDSTGIPVTYSDFPRVLDHSDGMLGFDPMANAYPIFGETHSRSPFAMADDFAAWLFNEPMAPLGYSMMPVSQNQFYANESPYTNLTVIPQHPMSMTSILDSGSLPAIISEEKRQELLQLMATRFNEAAYSPDAKRKDALMDGDLNHDRHALSLRMMQTYIGSYWYHFHAQMPILHQPTFAADRTHNLLLLAIIAIGAATLDKVHGSATTETAAELANFIAWHLRWEIFMDADCRPPARLWVFQALLLLEIFEKGFSTRALHERAHIHHDTTLTLMRRGSSLIGRSPSDTPELKEEDESWSQWIKAESTRRVAFAAFIIDSTHASMYGHAAKIVAHELRLPMPCDEALWAATSAAEVARVQSSLQSHGVRPVMFLDGLKRTLNGQAVSIQTPFGRSVLLAGLLSVSWHLNQRDLQISSLGVGQTLDGRDKWRTIYNEALSNFTSVESQSCDILHGLAHMVSHVDIVDLQIFAGAGRLMGRSVTSRDYTSARDKTNHWATKASARDATFYALKFLSACSSEFHSGEYVARDDYLLNRPWVIYFATLVVWCYGFALNGPLQHPPVLATAAERRYNMDQFLRRIGGIREPQELEGMKGCNDCMGLLMVIRDSFANARWELLGEASLLLDNCIAKLQS